MISRYDQLMADWRPKPTARELLRQADELEVLMEWNEAGIDVESLYHVARDVRERYSVDIPSEATESPRNATEGPSKGID